jgi:hypothetical protein
VGVNPAEAAGLLSPSATGRGVAAAPVAPRMRREAGMFNETTLLADALGRHLAETYQRIYGGQEPEFGRILDSAGKLVIERIANSDALYHNTNHTALVTLVGEAILRGRLLSRRVEPADWLHFMLALLTHDIGYVRYLCAGDADDRFVVDEAGTTVRLPRGASDAALAPYHVDRSKIAVRARFAAVPAVDAERIARAIEMTRFPIPDDGRHDDTDTEPGLVRAADFIGQLADPLYLRRMNALYYEFTETGMAERCGYTSPADMVDKYPAFFWNIVEPYIGDALRYLELTIEGKQWIANLYSHVFTIEHQRRRLGPQHAVGDIGPVGAAASAR